MTECPFCRRIRDPSAEAGRLLFEDDLLWVAHELEEEGPTYRGMVAIVLKRHGEGGLSEMTDEEGARIGQAVARVARAFRSVLGVPWAYTYCFTEGFRHVHQFVVARYPGVPDRYVRLGLQAWPGAPRGDEAEIRNLVGRLRAAMGVPSEPGGTSPEPGRPSGNDD
ncbi:MAG TPA: hypothetical protein VGS23_09715 [Thermoplasmata archaeon]|nr:hypothetical protein [Thermoplasmata archaeon]